MPAIPCKTAAVGAKRAKATLELVKIWDCEKSLCDMVFDTTSSNTGAQTAACVALQNVVSKPLLWFACRHHIGEIILTYAWDALHIEVSKSPKISIFQRFRQFYPTVSTVCESFDFHEILQTLQSRRENTIQMCNAYLQQPFSRGNYKELVELTLLYLGNSKTKATFKTFRKPGALHKARWMSKLLYSIKMDLLGSNICDA